MPHRNTARQAWATKLVVLLFLISLLAACTAPLLPAPQGAGSPNRITAVPSPTPTAPPTATPVIAATAAPTLAYQGPYHQSPKLENLTQARALPLVQDRLPEHPKVVPVNEKLGRYGGSWHMVIQPASDQNLFVRTVAYEPLIRWTRDFTGIEPNLAESYGGSGNGKEYTITLRRGLRWSDGEPFTTEDIRFWYKDVLLNPELTPVVPPWLKAQGEPAVFEFVDDVTFKVYFRSPNTQFLHQLATPDALMITAFPAHYAKKYHAAYQTPEELDQLVKASGVSSWSEMFIQRFGVTVQDKGNYTDPDRPRMTAWVLKDTYRPDKQTITWERNPYYWKIDTAGNQLPYIDSVVFLRVNSSDEAIRRALNGEVDMQNLSALGIDVNAAFASLPQSPYGFYRLQDGSNNIMTIHLNQSHPDPVKRAIFQNRNFRIGLSLAINRQEIINVLFGGKGKPWQAAPRENSEFFDAAMGTQYTEYDPERANSYLDQAGYLKDRMGKRLRPDGLPLTFTIEVLENDPQQIAMLNMVAKYWAAVGVEVQPLPVPLPVFLADARSNLQDAAAAPGGATLLYDVLLNPADYLPCSDSAYWGEAWVNWRNGLPGFEDYRPAKDVLTSLGYLDRLRMITNLNTQVQVLRSGLQVAREAFWTMGIAQGPDAYGVVKNNFHNVPQQMPSSWIYPDPAPTNPEQYFFSQ